MRNIVTNLINVRVFLCNKVGLGLLDWGLQLYISPEKGPIREETYFKRVLNGELAKNDCKYYKNFMIISL